MESVGQSSALRQVLFFNWSKLLGQPVNSNGAFLAGENRHRDGPFRTSSIFMIAPAPRIDFFINSNCARDSDRFCWSRELFGHERGLYGRQSTHKSLGRLEGPVSQELLFSVRSRRYPAGTFKPKLPCAFFLQECPASPNLIPLGPVQIFSRWKITTRQRRCEGRASINAPRITSTSITSSHSLRPERW